ncbi:MAG: hypothetical protein U9N34_03725 [Candidatus Cloacimonadota bacterium]|nr:hypothetical protein [Candidatus Cloacimonadota bacterium]
MELLVYKVRKRLKSPFAISRHVYGGVNYESEQRVKEAMVCPHCGGDKFILIPEEMDGGGGKPYIMCANKECGEYSHL